MGDTRYHDLLGLDAAIEQPNYYELLKVAPSETQTEVIEKSYKEQMTKLQQNKSPKHKGFIEFLKDELRNAKLTLTNASRRKEYDASLSNKHVEGFKQLVTPLLALGEVPKKVYETLVQNGVSKHGLSDEAARTLIQEMAKAANATIQLEEPPPPPPTPTPTPAPTPAPAAPGPTLDDQFFDAVDDTGRATGQPLTTGNSYYGSGSTPPPPADSFAPRMSRFSERNTPPPPPGEPAIDSPGGPGRIQRGRFYDFQDDSSSGRPGSDRLTPRPGGRSPSESDWNRRDRERAGQRSPSDSDWNRARARDPNESGARRGGDPSESGHRRGGDPSESGRSRLGSDPNESGHRRTPAPPGGDPSESGRRRAMGSPDAPPPWQQPSQDVPWFQRDPARETPSGRQPRVGGPTPLSPEQAKVADEARKAYNGGIKLAKLAVAAHAALTAYFPRNSDPIARINGVSYEEAFRTEHKMLKEALPQFKKALEKLGSLQGGFADELRTRAENNAAAIEHYMKEWKELKFKLEFQGAKKSETNRLWADYARARRVEALTQEIEKPSEYV